MKRFFGMMPIEEIEIEKHYDNGIIIQAGKLGWSIIYKDGSSEYDDCSDSAVNNFNKAYNTVKKHFGDFE